ncbi:hypothetical protein G7Y89_g7471 [Cudoniella acicularis]|uniref:Ran-specific GTPase-activating protein 30 n=1 Tax=Cudoniella acicularis TaxID=354080 RepID=A0A8H4RJ89_9HELO|nr:hypothetical protein G7Y89_g7471 [Cudoniella acicularis]
MEVFLGKITQHAMNYAIRSGIGITASFAIKQTSRLLKTVEDNDDYRELQSLQERLDSKTRIISPAIDMIELISARGNTTLESAVALTKALRWGIQSLGVRLEKAAAAEETSRKQSTRAKSREGHEVEIRHIVQDIRKLLTRIEDAVPLINLAITTSGASLSTTLPATVSPSRLLQASTFLTAGDTQYSMNPGLPVQIGPTFTLSLYMLFAGHAYRLHEDTESLRETTWKEVIHKARVKLLRTPLHLGANGPDDESESPTMSGEGKANEYAYHIEIIEDLDDDRVHSFEDEDVQPGPYGGVSLAGIREALPIHQISKIFYADTGKILNIGNQGEANNPVLLLKRDINALPPRRMMQDEEKRDQWYEEDPDESEEAQPVESEDLEKSDEESNDSQDDIDAQLRRESSTISPVEEIDEQALPAGDDNAWRFPPDLDPEWLAFEVYTEAEDSNSESGDTEPGDISTYISHRPSSSAGGFQGSSSLAANLASLNISSNTASPSPSPSLTPANLALSPQKPSNLPSQTFNSSPFPQPSANPTSYGPIRSSLSLLEMLIRLTALQQFQQASHLSIPDELLTFFLEESSTTGAGGEPIHDGEQEEMPAEKGGTPERYRGGSNAGGLWSQGGTPQHGTPEPWLLRSREASRQTTPDIPPSSPVSPYRPVHKSTRPLPVQRVKHNEGGKKRGSPLGRSFSVDTDSTLGTSPGSPTLVDRRETLEQARVESEE